jgi:hypothetical protein
MPTPGKCRSREIAVMQFDFVDIPFDGAVPPVVLLLFDKVDMGASAQLGLYSL